jgi:hypothetical protein
MWPTGRDIRIATVVSALTLLTLTGVCSAQLPKGIGPDAIRTTLPLEGAPKAIRGPYEVTSEPSAHGAPGLMAFYPKNLDVFPKKDTLPVLA